MTVVDLILNIVNERDDVSDLPGKATQVDEEFRVAFVEVGHKVDCSF